MATPHRVVVYLNPRVYRTLRRKARSTKLNLSQVVDETLSDALSEDAADEQVFRERAKEPDVPYEVIRRRLKRDGVL